MSDTAQAAPDRPDPFNEIIRDAILIHGGGSIEFHINRDSQWQATVKARDKLKAIGIGKTPRAAVADLTRARR